MSGCYTPQQLRNQRILNNQELFDSFSPEIREQVRLGHIDLGVNQDMVRLAWGSPDRVMSRLTKAGKNIVWEYTKLERRFHPDSMSMPIYYKDDHGHIRTTFQSVWIDHETQREYTVARVEFARGVVIAIERLDQ